jgi:5,10-methylene-tetrahydrofolate dehydrogenase/methenyl tetrahydrofolate cyclohydrolase
MLLKELHEQLVQKILSHEQQDEQDLYPSLSTMLVGDDPLLLCIVATRKYIRK